MSASAPSSRRGGRIIAAVCAIVLSGIAAVPVGASGAELRVNQGGGARFPARTLVVSVPGKRRLTPSQIRVAENGRLVQGAEVTPITSAGAGDFGVILAIDVSPSMRGAPLARAISAARALAAQRSGKQELGVITFDRRATVALPLTDDPRAIARALAHAPAVGRGAFIYSALTLAVEQLEYANIAAGAVILLSDGASQGANPQFGNHVTASSIGAAASAAHVQIYTVGLRDSAFSPRRMGLLARAGGGAFIESTSSQLAGVFTEIEAGLTSAYVVHYRSLVSLGHRVTVSVQVAGLPQEAVLSYHSPPAPPAPLRHSRHESFWVSSLALVLFTCAASLLVGIAAFVLLARRHRRRGVRRRVVEFTAGATTDIAAVAHTPTNSLPALERWLGRAGWWRSFKTEAEIAHVQRTPAELVVMTAISTAAVALLIGVSSGSPVPSILALPLGPLVLRSVVKWRLRRQRELFGDQLPTHLQELASTMRAGHSLISGIAMIAESAPEPARSEWARVVADEQLGLPLEEAMRPLAERMQNDDVGQVMLVAILHQRTGGNMADVLERVAEAIRERGELRRELRALTAQARLSRYLLTALPLVVLAAVTLINPQYVEPLFDTTTGVILLLVGAGLLLGASRIMRAITDIKV